MMTAGRSLSSLIGLALLCGCPKGAEVESLTLDATVPDYTSLPSGGDPKALINNLIGRWYPEQEIKRLDDDTMVPEAWCARSPTKIQIWADEIFVQCDDGDAISAPIARVEQSASGGIDLVLRAKENAPMRKIHFIQVMGATALIEGTPCFKTGQKYARFPKFETLQRQILAGKRCSAIIAETKILNEP